MVKANGELDAKFCRARGLGAHNLAMLASAVVHNLKLAMTDPEAEDPEDESDDDPNESGDGSEAAANNGEISDPQNAPVGRALHQSAALVLPERSF